jgi:subtilisin family serine protease
MADKLYFWQGGTRIEIEEKPDLVTIEAPTIERAFEAAESAGVEVADVAPVSENMIMMRMRGSRDAGMHAIRGQGQVLHHVYSTPRNPDDKIIITDSFYLRFKSGVDQETRKTIVDGEKLEILDKIDRDTWLVRVTDATGTNPIRSANKLAKEEAVEFAEPNIVHTLQRFDTPPIDTFFPRQWHLASPTDGIDLVRGAGIDILEAWKTTIGDRSIVVCVADDGFDLTHPDLKGQNKVVGQINIIPQGNSDIATDTAVLPRPGDYHGTPCAGVAVAEVNDEGAVGVAPGCAFLPVRFPLNLSDAQLAKMFELVSSLADVISCSWGYGPTNRPMSTTLHDTIARLSRTGGRRGKGIVFCVAAGNNNCPVKDLSNTAVYKYLDHMGIVRSHNGVINRWIAAHTDAITVSASTSLKTRAAYSSWGVDINVCAPSNNFDDLQRFTPRGLGIVTIDNEGFGADTDFDPGSRFTARFGGTSSATPTVAGVCALILSVNAHLTADAVRRIIEETADKDLTISSETQVNAPGDFIDGFSQWFGHGKVNASKAVAAALTPGV